MTADNFINANRASWDERVESHLIAYGADAFADEPGAVSTIVRDDANAISPCLLGGTVDGLKLVHLQRHIGTDTLSPAH